MDGRRLLAAGPSHLVRAHALAVEAEDLHDEGRWREAAQVPPRQRSAPSAYFAPHPKPARALG